MAAIRWLNTLKEAKEEAVSAQKPIFIDVYDPG